VIALVGQSGAGKSSLVTVLTGRPPEEARAGEVTPEVRRHRMVAGRRATGASAADPAQVAHLAAEGAPSVELLDTPGYGDEGATEAERTAIRAACTEADLVLLVMDVRNSARRADASLLDAMASWFAARPHRTPPPILGVLTHVDQLSPFREWDPPYDWSAPTSPKERSIAEAVAYLDDVLGHRLAAVVPICTDVVSGRVHGVREWLEPVMASLLDRAHAGAMVRGLQADLDRERVGRVAGPMRNAGRALVSAAVRGAAMGGRRAGDDPGRSAPDGPR
jgi:predicted GTPase